MAKSFVLVCEDYSTPRYFIRLGLGIFWECGHDASEAKKFTTRAAASKFLIRSRKNRQGWRVLEAR